MDDTVETGFEEVRPLKGFRKRWATSSVADDFSVGDAEQVYVENLMGDPSSCGHDSLSGWDVLPMTAPICAEETVGEQNEPFDMHDSAPCVEVEDPFGGESAWKQCAMTAHSKRQRLAREKLPWELPGMSTVFRTGDCWSGTIIAGVKDMFLPSGIGISEVPGAKMYTLSDLIALPDRPRLCLSGHIGRLTSPSIQWWADLKILLTKLRHPGSNG